MKQTKKKSIILLSILCSNKRKKRSSCSTFCSVVIGETVIKECFGGGSFSFVAFVPMQRFMRVCVFLFLQVFVLVVQLFSPPGGLSAVEFLFSFSPGYRCRSRFVRVLMCLPYRCVRGFPPQSLPLQKEFLACVGTITLRRTDAPV